LAALVDEVLAAVTLPVLRLAALLAGSAAANVLASQLDEFALDALGAELGEDRLDELSGVAALARRTAYPNNLHGSPTDEC
jgi:hypothetical protein